MNAARPVAETVLHRAAAYVRMSTEQQGQSIALQLDYIARYAAAAECEVVKVYRDEGKSGLDARRRAGLQQLMRDIGDGQPGFDRVLVYDVSRWGRFQDVDESAYYEYLCSRGGVRVVYCAERFANDGSPLAHIIKSVKRTMAAEFSRALSERTFDAHAFLLARGYKPGGAAGFGLRRLSVRADGSVRRMLEEGERKCHPTDRVVLAPGPAAEQRTVRRIFRLYTEQGLSYCGVARTLNAEGVAAAGRAWSATLVKGILHNEKYCGNLLYNRSTARLGGRRHMNERSLWLRHEGAHTAIVSPAVFAAAQRQQTLRRGLDTGGVLARLRGIYDRSGTLNYRLIDAEPGMPHAALVKKMFGSLHRAYRLALAPVGDDLACWRTAAHSEAWLRLFEAVLDCIVHAGGHAQRTPNRAVIMFDECISLRVAVTRCRSRGGTLGWVVPAQAANTDFVLCGLMGQDGTAIVHYALLDVAACCVQHKWLAVRSSGTAGLTLSSTLEGLFGMRADAGSEIR
ncbi:recombinase family protein [Rugamonas apoptosis]|uniref:Recombinase family protein n=1 Tax=Rugamonas apoptosis TaxID=2758570 RepID=A0A7W2FF46_9BURK|nr:recombinase family protein [Rugamonas apoptosis]MBA5690566.1 recombinase family protein [Rugamonas apoptosis]